jgi:hypothetical protein
MTHPMTQKEPILFDGIEYEWKTLGGIFGLYRKDRKEWPKLDVSGYQPKKKKPAEQASLFTKEYCD